MKKALVIDGNSMFYRMYYATIKQAEAILERNGVPNNGIKLMIRTVIKLFTNENYDYILIAFDHGSKTFRHDEMETYKEGRNKTPDDLIKQMLSSKDMLDSMGFNVLSKENIEADDLIGSFAFLMNKHNIKVDVFSSDKDMLQLVDNNCDVHLMKTGITNIEKYTVDNFSSKYFGLLPNQVNDFKGIIGDSSDKLMGINGVGEKTGVKLIIQYGSLENIYQNLEELSDSIKNKFIKDKEVAYKCKRLSTILRDQFDNYDIEYFNIKEADNNRLAQISKEYRITEFDN